MTRNTKILFALSAFFLNTACTIEKPLVIITASYNNTQWCSKYFHSLVQQEYDNWIVIYIDDNSTDDTFEHIQSLAKEYHVEHKFIIIKNRQRYGHLYNQYTAIHTCQKDHIILIVDGDDWLANTHVFSTINKTYENENIWLTYGQFWYLKKNKKGFCRAIPPDILARNTIREISWRTSHLRTFYAGLFQQIPYQDLLYQGKPFPKCVDVVTMFAMIELAGKHIKFIPDILYIYNDDNPLSYHHNPLPQKELEAYIRTMPPYAPLKDRPW